jgi:hypothetical protein
VRQNGLLMDDIDGMNRVPSASSGGLAMSVLTALLVLSLCLAAVGAVALVRTRPAGRG